MKKLFFSLLVLFSINSFAETVKAEKTTEGASICYHKQVSLKGYIFANLIGNCSWDPAMNGMYLTLVAVSEDPMAEADKIELGNVRKITKVTNKNESLTISVVQDNFDEQENTIQLKQKIVVNTLDAKTGTFDVVTTTAKKK